MVAHAQPPVSERAAPEQTVLIVDDSEAIRNRVSAVLEQAGAGQRFLLAASATEALQLLAEHDVALVLCDIEMPDLDGFNFLRIKQQQADLDAIPVVMLTVQDNLEAKLRGLAEGASDYLTKPFQDPELVARVRVHLQTQALQQKLKRRNARLQELSRTDELTGLSNRRHFMEQLRAELARTARYDSPLSLILLDLDHFKHINDTYGHLVGDRVLMAVGDVLKSLLRQCDFAARYGGEEFALLLPETRDEGAMVVAERCRRAIEALVIDDMQVEVTTSLGVANFPADGLETADDLLRNADRALYHAKRHGRNRAVHVHAVE